jgi:maltooligosyltrehalose synthase
MRALWRWLKEDSNRALLGFLGGGLVALVAGGWEVFLPFSNNPESKASPQSSAQVSAGHDVVFRGPVTIVSADDKTQRQTFEQFRTELIEEQVSVAKGIEISQENTQAEVEQLKGKVQDLNQLVKELALDRHSIKSDQKNQEERLAQLLRTMDAARLYLRKKEALITYIVFSNRTEAFVATTGSVERVTLKCTSAQLIDTVAAFRASL